MSDNLINIIGLLPGVFGCLFLLGVYRAELRLSRQRMEIAAKMNWNLFPKRA